MMKHGGWRRPGETQEASCLIESVVEIMPVSQISLGKDEEIGKHAFSVAYWKRKTKNVFGC